MRHSLNQLVAPIMSRGIFLELELYGSCGMCVRDMVLVLSLFLVAGGKEEHPEAPARGSVLTLLRSLTFAVCQEAASLARLSSKKAQQSQGAQNDVDTETDWFLYSSCVLGRRRRDKG